MATPYNPITRRMPTIRRLVVTAAAALIVALNRRLGLGLEMQEVLALAGLAAAYVLQSGHVSAAKVQAGE